MNLLEAFVKLDEDAFDTTPKGIEDLSDFMDDADVVDDEIEIIDPDIDFGDDDTMPADDEESEEENAHVGQLVLQCNTCNALVYKDKDEVELDEDGNVEEEECPNCHNVSKFDVIGKICTVDDLEDELEGDEEESEEKEEDEAEKPEEESEEEVEVDDEEKEEKSIKEESLKRPLKESKGERLSNEEWNAISKLTHNIKLDDSFDIAEDEQHDFFIDYEEDEELSLEEGLELLADALAYPLSHDVSDEDAKNIVNVFKRYGIGDSDWHKWLLSKEESLRRPNKKSLKENRQKLNEGPGAGYTVSGDLTDIRINSFDFKVNGDEVIVNCDIDADMENVEAYSYYYGGEVGYEVPVKISQVSYYIYDDSQLNDSDVEEELEYDLSHLKFKAYVGGGWSHSTFDGNLEVKDIRNWNGEDSDIFNVIMHCTDEEDIQFIDDLVTGYFEKDEEEFDESLRKPRKIREAFKIDDSIIKEAEDIVNNADLTMTSIEEDGDEGGYIEITDKNSGMNFWVEYWPSNGDWDMDWNQYIFYNNHEDKLRKAIQEDSDFASWAFDIVRDNLSIMIDESCGKKKSKKSVKESVRKPRNKALKESWVEEWWGQTEENPKEFASQYGLKAERVDKRNDEILWRFTGKLEDIQSAIEDGYFYSLDFDDDSNASPDVFGIDESLKKSRKRKSCKESLRRPRNKSLKESVKQPDFDIEPDEVAIYLFPKLEPEDISVARNFNLSVDNEYDDVDTALIGKFKDLKNFATNYLDYQLVDGYLLDKDGMRIPSDETFRKFQARKRKNKKHPDMAEYMGVHGLDFYDAQDAVIDDYMGQFDESLRRKPRKISEKLTKKSSPKDKILKDVEKLKKESLKEDLEGVTVDTDSETIQITQKEDGGVAVETSPKVSDESFMEEPMFEEPPMEGDEVPGDEEVIEPLTDEEEEEIAEENPESEEDEEEIEDIDSDSFDELGESYLKEAYENVKSFKTSKVYKKNGKLIVEGIVSFKSGKNKKTSFIFESAHNKSKKKVLLGENKQITPNSKSFRLRGVVKDKKMVCESLRYNYKEGKNRVSGVCRVK